MNNFSTKDIQIASCLLAKGYQVVRLETNDSKIFQFVFDLDQSIAQQITQQHWTSQLLLPSKDLFSAFNELKSRIYSGR